MQINDAIVMKIMDNPSLAGPTLASITLNELVLYIYIPNLIYIESSTLDLRIPSNNLVTTSAIGVAGFTNPVSKKKLLIIFGYDDGTIWNY
jgi:hypothetical protein